MSSRTAYHQKRREVLMKRDPHCFWCRKKLVSFKPRRNQGKLPDNFPTIDHLYSRFWGLRPKPDGKTTLVLACPSCNHERARQDHINNKWRTHWRSATFPWYVFPFEVALRLYRGLKIRPHPWYKFRRDEKQRKKHETIRKGSRNH
jgi:ssDNA-binding Zn-finger/Zn-ribbon topoisomerase 1